MSFDQFNLHEEVLDGLRDMGFEMPTPIQESCVPLIMEGRDVLASAQTGTGKTAAFAIPVLEKLSEKKKNSIGGIRALIITPTRELAGQVDEAFFAIGYHTGLTTAKVYGGDDWSRQEKALSRGTNIIVATPGRLLDHMKIHDVDFSNLDFLILDEADRMLDMGFIPDITQIVSSLPKERQTLLFSATLPQKIVQLARKMMNNPERVNMAPSNKAAEGVSQGMYYVEERDKLPLVLHLYEKEKWPSAIIFMSTKRAVDKLTRELGQKGASVTSIHGDRTQAEREKALESFRKGDFRIIVATDVMARGIDVEGISHIINFSVPHDVEDYVHRIGRTARAEATGDALTLVSGQDRRYMENIIRGMDSEIKKLEVPDFLTKSDRSGDDKGRNRGRSKDGKDRRKESGGPKKPQSGPKKDPKDAPVADKPERKDQKSGKKGENSPKRMPEDKQETAGASSKQDKPEASTGQETESTPKPKRRRGRKRPGGNRSSGKAPRKQTGKESGAEQAGKQSGEEATSTGGKTESKGGPSRNKQKRQPSVKGRKSDGGQHKSAHRQSSGPRRGRAGTPDKTGQNKKQRSAPIDPERKELFDNVTAPDMERVNRSVGKKRGVWSKIKKGLFGSD